MLLTYLPVTGRVWGRTLARNDHDHLLARLEGHPAEIPTTIRRIHYILDGGCSHIAKDTRKWAEAQRGRVLLHFTPARASWLNRAELALSAFSRWYLLHRVSESRAELIAHIHRALDEYNRIYARPFDWSFRDTLCMTGTLAELGRPCTTSSDRPLERRRLIRCHGATAPELDPVPRYTGAG